MYNKYNTLIYADAKKQHLSTKKSQNWGRPQTYPDSYDLLAWSYLNMQKKIKH
jgi:hypothetical protein